MKPPVISVVMATYNHASYVAQAIASVLKQSDVHFEFLIADDGSTDATSSVVESINDPRISFFPHRINRGACIVTNELIERAQGEFIALINSDDCWDDEDKLSFQLNILRENPGVAASFGRARFVDNRGEGINKKRLSFGRVFDQENRTQGEWLRHFFFNGNCLCHPTVLIRRKCYEELGAYSNSLRQLPDFEMWIRLVKRYPIHVSERELISFRVLPGASASSHTVSNAVRTMNEHYLIADTFFQYVNQQQLKDGFAQWLRYPEIPSDIHLDIEKALLFFVPSKALGKAYRMIGILQLSRLLGSAKHRQVLEEEYGIDGRWFQAQTGNIDILRPKIVAIIGKKTIVWRNVLKRLFRT
ncbi:glycosyltransferase [Pseudomonas sp. NPDC087342]|uniref:glycosyltransferase n=1 Tax=Pseudomonas sp. NPDC087342 TaxID=3364437 RepID=UPI0037FBD9DA